MAAITARLPFRKSKVKAQKPEPLVSPLRHPIRWTINFVQTLLVGAVGTYIGVLFFVTVYYLLFEVDPWMTQHWHQWVANSDTRHTVRNVGEGFFGGLVGVALAWNHYKLKAKKLAKVGLVDRLEIKLRIPNLKDNRQSTGWAAAALLPLCALYALPGGLFGFWLSHVLKTTITDVTNAVGALHVQVTHASSFWTKTEATFSQNWDKKLIGYFAAFVFGRRPAKGFFDDMQLSLAQRRVIQGKKVRWYHPPAYRARYNEVCGQGIAAAAEGQRRNRAQSVLVTSLIIVVLGFAAYGWYILNYIAK